MDVDRRRALLAMKEEGIIIIGDGKLKVHNKGMAFIRNVCLQFDQRYWHSQERHAGFSSSI